MKSFATASEVERRACGNKRTPIMDMETVVLITGIVIVANLAVKAGLERTFAPAMAGYLLLGILLRLCDARWGFMGAQCREVFDFLAKIGVIVLLFRVGLEADIKKLLEQLPRAGIIWVGDILISGLAGFSTAFYILGMKMTTSLIVAVAFTATSVGITVAVWQNNDALDSREGRLLIDVAEMDDISAVVLMALLFSLLPVLGSATEPMALLPAISKTVGVFAVKFVAFGAMCVFFSLFVEKPVTDFFRKLTTSPEPMLLVTGIGIIVAALAGLLGFSFAIGAFFAGLMFGRDKEAVNMKAGFLPIHALFSPFFFIGIGLDVDPNAFGASLIPAFVLLAAAIMSKLAANTIPVLAMYGWTSALLIGTSMTPRAEIAMIVMQRGLKLGDGAVGSEVYSAMILLSVVTCIVSPLSLQFMLGRWPPGEKRTPAK